MELTCFEINSARLGSWYSSLVIGLVESLILPLPTVVVAAICITCAVGDNFAALGEEVDGGASKPFDCGCWLGISIFKAVDFLLAAIGEEAAAAAGCLRGVGLLAALLLLLPLLSVFWLLIFSLLLFLLLMLMYFPPWFNAICDPVAKPPLLFPMPVDSATTLLLLWASLVLAVAVAVALVVMVLGRSESDELAEALGSSTGIKVPEITLNWLLSAAADAFVGDTGDMVAVFKIVGRIAADERPVPLNKGFCNFNETSVQPPLCKTPIKSTIDIATIFNPNQQLYEYT